jgi:hypothetical protein
MCLFGAAACGGLASDGPGSQEPIVDDDVGVVDVEPDPASPPSQAVASLRFGAPGDACPAPMTYMVPNSDALTTLENGAGERAIDGRDGEVRCRVASLPDPDRSFAIDLSYRQGLGGDDELHVMGELSGGLAAGRVLLQLNLPPTGPIEAECRAEVQAVLSGAIWLRATDCTRVSYGGESVDCDVELGMIFENCSR